MTEQTKEKMDKTIEKLQRDFSTIRSGAAHPSLLDNLMVEVYGSHMALPNVATVAVQDATTLTVQVWDQGSVAAVDKAIRTSELSLNPKIEGNKLFIPLPPLTSDRRKEFIKIVKNMAEETRISIRNLRRVANDKLKEDKKNGDLSEDELENALKTIQTLTDKHTETIDQMLSKKEKDLSTL